MLAFLATFGSLGLRLQSLNGLGYDRRGNRACQYFCPAEECRADSLPRHLFVLHGLFRLRIGRMRQPLNAPEARSRKVRGRHVAWRSSDKVTCQNAMGDFSSHIRMIRGLEH